MSDIDDLEVSGKWNTNRTEQAAWGLVPLIKTLGHEITGLEIGIHTGLNSYMLLQHCENIKMLYGIDPYIAYHDWRELIDQGMQNHVKEIFQSNLKNLGNRFTWLHKKSSDVVNNFQDASLDFIFIDGDHSEEGVLSDLVNYVPKVRAGGLVGGHDLGLEGIQKALLRYNTEFDSTVSAKLTPMINHAWYWIKD